MKASYRSISLRLALLLGLILALANPVWAQTDSLEAMLSEAEKPAISLLPEHMMATQSLLWGRRGLMRITGISKLNEENRAVELRLRRTMLISHQVLGYLTLAAMLAQGIIGSKVYYHPNDRNLSELHSTMAGVVNACYFTTAGLSLFSPPPLISSRTKGLNSIKAHKALAYVHFTGMVLTNILAPDHRDPTLRSIHRAAAYTSFGAFAAAMVVMTF